MNSNAWLSHTTGNYVTCDACAHMCKLKESQYGICGVRKVENGSLLLIVYGAAAAVNIDPIEKKPLFHFLPGSTALSIGTVGCNFGCLFCQNYDISQFPKNAEHNIFGKKLPPDDVVKMAKNYNVRSIAYTYNEPAVFFEYAYDCAKLANENGIKNIFVTSGYETPVAIDTILPYLDAMNIDLKSNSEKFYRTICKAKLAPVLNAIQYAYNKRIWIEITTLLIPGENDSDSEIRQIAQFIAGISETIPWHLSAFFPTYKMIEPMPTPAKTLLRAYKIAKDVGLKYVYFGNINNTDHESTYCPKCGKMVIKRSGHIGSNVLNMMKGSACPFCGYSLEGVWQ